MRFKVSNDFLSDKVMRKGPYFGDGSAIVATVGLEQVTMLREVSAQITRQMAIEHEKVVRLFELLRRIKDVVWCAHNHCIANKTFVIRFRQIATEFDSTQADTNSEYLVIWIFIVNVIHDHVKILVVAGTIRSSGLEFALDATIVHDNSGTLQFDCFLDQMSHIVFFR